MMKSLLSPLGNVLVNPGCKSFALKCDGGFNLNVSIKEVPEIDTPTCDLLPMLMSTDHGS